MQWFPDFINSRDTAEKIKLYGAISINTYYYVKLINQIY